MCCPHQFHETVTFKTDDIGRAGLHLTALLPDVYLLRDIVRDVLASRYNKLPFVALPTFSWRWIAPVAVRDAVPDHKSDGLLDDIHVVWRTREKFKGEIEGYLKWRENFIIG